MTKRMTPPTATVGRMVGLTVGIVGAVAATLAVIVALLALEAGDRNTREANQNATDNTTCQLQAGEFKLSSVIVSTLTFPLTDDGGYAPTTGVEMVLANTGGKPVTVARVDITKYPIAAALPGNGGPRILPLDYVKILESPENTDLTTRPTLSLSSESGCDGVGAVTIPIGESRLFAISPAPLLLNGNLVMSWPRFVAPVGFDIKLASGETIPVNVAPREASSADSFRDVAATILNNCNTPKSPLVLLGPS